MNKEYVLAMFTIKDLRSEFVTAPAIPPPPLPPAPCLHHNFKLFCLCLKSSNEGHPYVGRSGMYT